jgi:UDP-N-acetylmuramyl pentapeptide phosphotransferase/UDP-N-acetylglucosamine-1-phosphate transferase
VDNNEDNILGILSVLLIGLVFGWVGFLGDRLEVNVQNSGVSVHSCGHTLLAQWLGYFPSRATKYKRPSWTLGGRGFSY